MTSRGIERFDLAAIEPSPWKNGAGLTREIAVHPKEAGLADFGWRISVAEVVADAPFSAFAGIDRSIVLLSGVGMLLNGDGAEFRLDRPLAPLRFPGDSPLQATLIDGPCRDFNVMTRRGAWQSEVVRHEAELTLAGDAAGLLLCIDGTWQFDIDEGQVLGPMQGVFWRQPIDGLTLRPTSRGTLLQVSLCQHPQR